MLITPEFFIDDIFIANLTESCDKLTMYGFIDSNEEDCLRITLGDCVYEELVNQLEWSETEQKYVLKSDADEKWDWLINGHTYSVDDIDQSLIPYSNCGCGCNGSNCKTFHWDGIIKTIVRRIPTIEIGDTIANGIEIKKSFIAYYIYWLYSQETDSFSSSTGEQVAEVKGGSRISNSTKRIQAHNKFVSWVIECNSNGSVGLYRFMQDFPNLFPEWGGKCLKYESIW